MRRDVADHAEANLTVGVIDLHVLDRAIKPRHAAGDRAALERRPGRAACGEDAILVAEDQLRIRADVHHGDEPVLVKDVDREHACRGVGADVAADDRAAVHARFGMNRQQRFCRRLR